MIVPDEPYHTVHDVALERAPAESLPVQIRELARAYAKEALEVLAAVMSDETVTASTRVIAAIAVLDRGCGKAGPAPDDDADRAEQLETIRHIIVDPAHPDPESVQAADGAGPL